MGPKFTVIKRKEWGAEEPKEQLKPLDLPVKVVVIHHAGEFCDTKKTCKAAVKKLQEQHMKEKNYADIRYNFLIGGDGRVYEGRGWRIQGEHVADHDHETIGVAFLGSFHEEPPTDEMAETFRGLVYYGVRFGYLQEGKELETMPHTGIDMTTYCPGIATLDLYFDQYYLEPNEHWSKRTIFGKLWDKLVGFEI